MENEGGLREGKRAQVGEKGVVEGVEKEKMEGGRKGNRGRVNELDRGEESRRVSVSESLTQTIDFYIEPMSVYIHFQPKTYYFKLTIRISL